jgi:hypothetical protein
MRIGLFCFIICTVIIGCGKSSGYKEILPDEVIRRHVQFLDEKNVDAAESCLVKERRNQIDWQLDHKKHIRILSLQEEKNDAVAKSYMETGRGSITHPYQLKVFKVALETEYTSGTFLFDTDKDNWYYFVVKKTEESPWLIDDWGV